MQRKLVFVLAGILLLACLNCQRGGEPNGGGGGVPRIAFVMKTANNPFFIEMQKGAEAEAEKLGVTLVVQAAEREVDVE